MGTPDYHHRASRVTPFCHDQTAHARALIHLVSSRITCIIR